MPGLPPLLSPCHPLHRRIAARRLARRLQHEAAKQGVPIGRMRRVPNPKDRGRIVRRTAPAIAMPRLASISRPLSFWVYVAVGIVMILVSALRLPFVDMRIR